MIDLHLHSTYSVDGKNTPEEIVLSAIDNQLTIICFTEHFDLNKNDYGFGYFKEKSYFSSITSLRDKYSDKITILIGIEFSEPHIYQKEFDEFQNKEYDYILGSVHWVGDKWIGDKEYTQKYSIKDLYLMHYKETLKACKYGGFDSLAHFDFPKRYLKEKHEPKELINAILHEMIKNQITIEINSSPLRKGYSEHYPSDYILAKYKEFGGKYFTIGSDSHNINDVGADIKNITIHDLELCYYKNRQLQLI